MVFIYKLRSFLIWLFLFFRKIYRGENMKRLNANMMLEMLMLILIVKNKFWGLNLKKLA